jgi:hypothetical protein
MPEGGGYVWVTWPKRSGKTGREQITSYDRDLKAHRAVTATPATFAHTCRRWWVQHRDDFVDADVTAPNTRVLHEPATVELPRGFAKALHMHLVDRVSGLKLDLEGNSQNTDILRSEISTLTAVADTLRTYIRAKC